MKENDYVVCVFEGRCRYVAKVIGKRENAALAQALWGTTKTDDGSSEATPVEETWQHMFFLDQPTAINVPLKQLNGYMPSRFPGFARVGGKNEKNIHQDFGTIKDFLEKKLLVAPSPQKVKPVKFNFAGAKLFMSADEFEKAVRLLGKKKNLILQGAPGVGKTFVARNLAYALIGHKVDNNIEIVQFHQTYSYEDFIQGFRPVDGGGFTLRDGIFYRFCDQAKLAPNEKFVLIIDEINRGNLSKIFGELLMLIEEDKRDPSYAIRLAYADKTAPKFHVPPNVHIIGMMNTADRSLTSIDYALRRRFAFLTIRPAYGQPALNEHLESKGWSPNYAAKIVARMEALNEQIEKDKQLREGFCIGHSYFCSAVPANIKEDDYFSEIVETEIQPLLEDYWFDKDPGYVTSAVKNILKK